MMSCDDQKEHHEKRRWKKFKTMKRKLLIINVMKIFGRFLLKTIENK